MISRLHVRTCATRHYIAFVPLFVHSTLVHNPSAIVSIVTDQDAAAVLQNSVAMAWLRDHFADQVHVEIDDRANFYPQFARFLGAHNYDAQYIYFCDVDFFIAEEILELMHAEEAGLEVTNALRTEWPRRLTGLHFTAARLWDDPQLGKITKLLLRFGLARDEHILHREVRRSLAQRGSDVRGLVSRPLPGLHVAAFSRFPFARVGPQWSSNIGASGATAQYPHHMHQLDAYLKAEATTAVVALCSPSEAVVFSMLRLYLDVFRAKVLDDTSWAKIKMLTG